MQGVPLFPDSLSYTGINQQLLDYKAVSPSALRRMAGNSFSQPCMCGFIAFVMSHTTPASETTNDGVVQVIYQRGDWVSEESEPGDSEHEED